MSSRARLRAAFSFFINYNSRGLFKRTPRLLLVFFPRATVFTRDIFRSVRASVVYYTRAFWLERSRLRFSPFKNNRNTFLSSPKKKSLLRRRALIPCPFFFPFAFVATLQIFLSPKNPTTMRLDSSDFRKRFIRLPGHIIYIET